jgi:hypothetical protein
MKYQRPELHPMDESFPAYGACVSGDQASQSISCLSGVSATQSACNQGVHPEFSCTSGTLPGNDCASGSADSEW